ncbi:hypothetical protein GCM10009799_07090 [Nocardiopsis rhodophaea]|uniref:Uncharacterized protein n=1 Tax=Nocardiopsis rhodophaea TaxID=280238 RepID=A0ABN2SCH6_9ACTN
MSIDRFRKVEIRVHTAMASEAISMVAVSPPITAASASSRSPRARPVPTGRVGTCQHDYDAL